MYSSLVFNVMLENIAIALYCHSPFYLMHKLSLELHETKAFYNKLQFDVDFVILLMLS